MKKINVLAASTLAAVALVASPVAFADSSAPAGGVNSAGNYAKPYEKPGDNYSKPGDNYSKPGDNYSKPGDNYSKPGDNYSKPGDNYSKPGDNQGVGSSIGAVTGLDSAAEFYRTSVLSAKSADGRAVSLDNLKYGDILTITANARSEATDKENLYAEIHSNVIKLETKTVAPSESVSWTYRIGCDLEPGAHKALVMREGVEKSISTPQDFKINDVFKNCSKGEAAGSLAQTGTGSASLALLGTFASLAGAAAVGYRRFNA